MIKRTAVVVLTVATAATLAAGLTSYWRGLPRDALWIDTNDDRWRVQAAVLDGTLHLVQVGTAQSWPARTGSATFDAQRGPFYARRVARNAAVATGVGTPFWALGTLFAILPVWSFLSGPVRRRIRRRRGRCVKCGYPLQGLPEPRCPECGTPFPAECGRASAKPPSAGSY